MIGAVGHAANRRERRSAPDKLSGILRAVDSTFGRDALQLPSVFDPSLVSFTEPDSSGFFSAVRAGIHAGCRKLFSIVLAGATD